MKNNEVRLGVKLFLVGMIFVMVLVIYVINRLDKTKDENQIQTGSVTLVESKMIEVASANPVQPVEPNSAPVVSNNIAVVVVEERASFKFASASNRPVFVSEREVRDMQESARIRQLQQQLGSTPSQTK